MKAQWCFDTFSDEEEHMACVSIAPTAAKKTDTHLTAFFFWISQHQKG